VTVPYGAITEIELQMVMTHAALVAWGVDALDGRPLPGARGDIESVGAVTTAGPDGVLRFEGLPAGSLDLTVNAPDHVQARLRVPVLEERAGEARVLLQPRCVATVDFVGPDGAPTSANLQVLRDRRIDRDINIYATQERFEVSGPPGVVHLQAWRGALQARGTLELRPGPSSTCTLRLAPAGPIAGRFTWATGEPWGDVTLWISALDADGHPVDGGESVEVDEEGRFELLRPPGRYRLQAEVGGDGDDDGALLDVVVEPGQPPLEVVVPGTTVRGRVTDPIGRPCGLCVLFLVGPDGPPRRSSCQLTGEFELRAVRPGRYKLLASTMYLDRFPPRLGAVTFDVGAAPVAGVELPLRTTGARLEGRILDPDGRPVAIRLGVSGLVNTKVKVAPEGRFISDPLLPGDWELSAAADDLALLAWRRRVSRVSLEPRTFHLGPHQVETVELRLVDHP